MQATVGHGVSGMVLGGSAITWKVMATPGDDVGAEALVDPDWEVLVRVATGDRDAFAQLVNRHQSRIVNLCHRLLDDREDALDVAQEVFLKAFREAGRFEPRALVSTWLHRIATNLCLNRLRRRALVRWVPFLGPQQDGETHEWEPIDPGADPEQRWSAARELAAVRRAITQLPPNQRVVLGLVRFEGWSYREAAAALGITEGAVESRLVRAMRRLHAAREAA